MLSKTAAARDELLSAVDAAKILGLSADMVRLMARDGRLPAAAQTVRGLRLFRRKDVEDLACERAGSPVPQHVVQFYEKDEVLCATVANLMGVALRAGAPVVIIATESHRNELCARLESDGLDVGRFRDSGQLALQDAGELLATFMVDGMPDEDLFRKRVGDIIQRAAAARPRARVRFYGEMVELLTAEGKCDAAIRLEELWNDLGRVHSFALLCAYRIDNFRQSGQAASFQRICAHHTDIVPAESYPQSGLQEDCLREIALLQQRAQSLESEIDQRKRAEMSLREALAEQRRVEEALRQSEDELRRKNEKLEEVTRAEDEFLAMLGHELCNPLAPIQTAFELMRLRGLESREQALVERQVGLLARVAEQILDLSRLTRGSVQLRREPVDLLQVVKRAIESAGPMLERRQHRLDIQVPRGIVVEVDPARMAQVIANLLTNAARYSDPGSPVLIRASREDGRVRLSVRDEGVGIAPEMIDRVFDSYLQQPRTLPRAGGGLGLGLAIVRNLVQLHGGTVTVHSGGHGKGSEFAVEIAALPGERATMAAPSSPASGSSARELVTTHAGRRVLVVDDNADLASLIAELLEHLGYQVELAHDGPSALDVAATFEPDVALLDIDLPVMDGYELARRLRALRDEKVHLVAVTGYGQEADRRRSEEAGFAGHLVKPVSPELLARAVEGVSG